ncbi:caspase family protein [Chthonobacter albigriseus]|uniref:caspase family protein n=1 Tax=Chthonobacter albigriseus TaxID=1683161 RepID=UPI0015EEB2FF|nr:caspase family protein [Chthonobacter albigriseus]
MKPAAFALSMVLLLPATAQAEETVLMAPDGGVVRAITVGVDLYRSVPPLRGAVADAEDVDLSLRKVGVEDRVLLTDGAATRSAIFDAIDGLAERSGPGDLVLLSIAGHGSSEPERIKGTKPNGREEVYLLAGFDSRGPGTRERIFGDEFKVAIQRIEARGANVIFVADTCHAGGLTRKVDGRAPKLGWRQAPAYKIEDDALDPISTAAANVTTDFDFRTLTFLAAVDESSKVAEIRIPGEAKVRGALSYAVARAMEGAADRDGSGSVTRRELFEYVRQTVYQFTDQRQNVVTRSVVQDLDAAPVLAFGALAAPAGEPLQPEVARQENVEAGSAVRVSTAAGTPELEGIAPSRVPFVLSDPADADLVFDPATGDAIVAGGDVIATGLSPADVPFVVDRLGAVAALKQISAAAPETVRALPSDAVHRAGERVGVEVGAAAGRHLVLFNIAGDGTVQLLRPPPRGDQETRLADRFRLEYKVVEPFGADTLVAVSSDEAMPLLTDFLRQADGRRASGVLPSALPDLLPQDARIGFAALYTSP